MKILGIGAHPDDLEIACGGTLARFYLEGNSITMCYAANGDKGHFTIPPEELAKIRRKEAETAANVIGAKSFYLGFNDGEIIGENLENRLVFIDLIRKVEPQIILTHGPRDYHADHMAVSRLVVDAAFMSTVPHIKTKHKALVELPQIYFVEPYGGIQFEPDTYVDITAVMELKLKMMSEHKSQVVWLKEHDKTDILEYLKTIGRFRGVQCGKNYAEGFMRHQASLRGLTERILP